MAEVRQRSLEATVAPAAVLLGHPDRQSPDLSHDAGAFGAPLRAAIVLGGDQASVPAQDRIGRHDRADLGKQPPSHRLALRREPTTLIVIEPDPLLA